MKLLKTIAAIGAFAALSATPAWADWSSGVVCGGGLFSTCASVEVTGATTNTVTITVMNEGGAQAGSYDAIFSAVGIYNLPAGVTNVAISSDGGSNMVAGPGNELNPMSHSFAAEAVPPPSDNGLDVGESVTFTITFDHNVTAEELADLGVSIHGISGPNNCSTKLYIEDQGTVTGGPDAPDPACSETVIPEPITMTLLATGLAGMGGVGFLRRKRDEETG